MPRDTQVSCLGLTEVEAKSGAEGVAELLASWGKDSEASQCPGEGEEDGVCACFAAASDWEGAKSWKQRPAGGTSDRCRPWTRASGTVSDDTSIGHMDAKSVSSAWSAHGPDPPSWAPPRDDGRMARLPASSATESRSRQTLASSPCLTSAWANRAISSDTEGRTSQDEKAVSPEKNGFTCAILEPKKRSASIN